MEKIKIENGFSYYFRGNDFPLVYLLTELNDELIQEIESRNLEVNIVALTSPNWDHDFSPWPYQTFGGGLNETMERIHQFASDKHLIKASVYCVGYSLGGLCSLVALTMIDYLKGCASVSGSLWYPDLVEYLTKYPIKGKIIYLSLGDKEPKTKHLLMQMVGERTEQIKEILEKDNNVFFEYNPGNHFYQSNIRIAKALECLLKMK